MATSIKKTVVPFVLSKNFSEVIPVAKIINGYIPTPTITVIENFAKKQPIDFVKNADKEYAIFRPMLEEIHKSVDPHFPL